MSYGEKRVQLESWLEEFSAYRAPKGEWFRFKEGEDGRGVVILCTAAHSYHLAFADDYLGATGSCRTQCPGETWTRGNDLPDGKFTRETFNKIIFAIVGYELVTLAPVAKPVEDIAA